MINKNNQFKQNIPLGNGLIVAYVLGFLQPSHFLYVRAIRWSLYADWTWYAVCQIYVHILFWIHWGFDKMVDILQTLLNAFCRAKNVYLHSNFTNVDSCALTWGGDKMAAIFQTIFSDAFWLMKKRFVLITISLKFIPKGPIDNNPALVNIMTRRRIGDKPLFESMLTLFSEANMRQ